MLWELTSDQEFFRQTTAKFLADQVPVDGLVAFAFDCWPGAARLGIYRSLQLRRRIGPSVMPYLQPLVVTAYAHHARERLWWRTWRRTGI